ncbi:MAG: ABC transporter permease [Clostridia bacterium]|nr:ABC transporter permease [Clostridia bacterium]
MVIALLSVMAYLGINFASCGIAQNGNRFYDATHFRDAEVISTLLVSPDDLAALLAVEGVSDAEDVYQTAGKVENGGLRSNVDVVSLTERISTPLLLEGRLPETESECAVDQAILEALDAQFDEITRYDVQIRFDPDVSAAAESELEELLTAAGTDWAPAHMSTHTFSVDGKLMSASLIAGDLEAIDRFFVRLDPQKDRQLPAAGEGIWIGQRVWELNGVSAGDTITFYDGEMKPYELPVAGVFRIYAGQEMILSADQYETYFGQRLEYNTFYLRLNGADMSSLKEAVQAIDGVEEIAEVAETRALYQSLASVLNLIALMFVGIAGMMAYFILLNLVNMYINQKKRELTIMRVNGFTIREVDNYVLREMVVSTALGIALGLGAGTLLGYRVILLLEGTTVRFMRGIQWEAWLFAALITVVFAAVVNAAALRKVKYLKLTDVA